MENQEELINKYTERIMVDYPEVDKIHIDLKQFAQELSDAVIAVSGEQAMGEIIKCPNCMSVYLRQYSNKEITASKFTEIVNDKIIEYGKVVAANNVVNDSVLHGSSLLAKIKYISLILPYHYNIKESSQNGAVHCVSRIGIEDGEWNEFVVALRVRFNDLSEIFHNTCDGYKNFTIYFK